MGPDQFYSGTARFASIGTVIVLFYGVVFLAPEIAKLSSEFQWLSLIGSAIAALALYTALLRLMIWTFAKARWVRRLILGGGYLEGTWVGHYTLNDLSRYTIEYIDQTDGTTRIQGREFDHSGACRASWTSDAVSVNSQDKVLTYTYVCDVFETNFKQQGLGHFQIIRESKSKFPNKLDGYAVDVTDGARDTNTEIKISDDPIADEEALKVAHNKFSSGAQLKDMHAKPPEPHAMPKA